MAAKAAAADALAAKEANSAPSTSAFFTGKPYVQETGSYSFKFRQYDPKLSRWTSADPSGFPNGANNWCYGGAPTGGLDALGLVYTEEDAGADRNLILAVMLGWHTLGYTYSVTNAMQSLVYGDNKTASSSEITDMKAASGFTSMFNKAYFAALEPSGYYNQNEIVNFSSGDLHYSYGQVAFNATGNFTYDAQSKWSTDVAFSFNDLYDFDPTSSNPAILAFNRLQVNNYAGYYSTSGTFNMPFSE